MLQSDIRKAIKDGIARFPGMKTKRNGSAKNRTKNDEEEKLQFACHSWNVLNQKRYPLLEWMFHCPNGGKRSKTEAVRFKAMGVKSGVPDFQLTFPSGEYCGLAIELKSARGKLSDEQRRWLLNYYEKGWCVAVVRTLDQYLDVVREFLNAGKAKDIMYGKDEILKNMTSVTKK